MNKGSLKLGEELPIPMDKNFKDNINDYIDYIFSYEIQNKS